MPPSEPAPHLNLHESEFTDAEMLQVHAALELLERKYAAHFDALAADIGIDAQAAELIAVGKVHELMRRAKAERDATAAAVIETARIETENIVRRDEHARAIAQDDQLRADLATMQRAATAQYETSVAELVELEARAATALAELATLETRKAAARD